MDDLKRARLLTVQGLLADPAALHNDALEGDLYLLRDQLQTRAWLSGMESRAWIARTEGRSRGTALDAAWSVSEGKRSWRGVDCCTSGYGAASDRKVGVHGPWCQ